MTQWEMVMWMTFRVGSGLVFNILKISICSEQVWQKNPEAIASFFTIVHNFICPRYLPVQVSCYFTDMLVLSNFCLKVAMECPRIFRLKLIHGPFPYTLSGQVHFHRVFFFAYTHWSAEPPRSHLSMHLFPQCERRTQLFADEKYPCVKLSAAETIQYRAWIILLVFILNSPPFPANEQEQRPRERPMYANNPP